MDAPRVLQFPLAEIDEAAQVAARVAAIHTFFENRAATATPETDLAAVSAALLSKLPPGGRRVNAWVRIEPLKVNAYIRYSHRSPDSGTPLVKVLDLASVEVDEGYTRRGLFTCLIAALETFSKQHGFAAVRVENVLNEGLDDALRRRGYAERANDIDPDCLWWITA